LIIPDVLVARHHVKPIFEIFVLVCKIKGLRTHGTQRGHINPFLVSMYLKKYNPSSQIFVNYISRNVKNIIFIYYHRLRIVCNMWKVFKRPTYTSDFRDSLIFVGKAKLTFILLEDPAFSC
jgi:hypothetical protein